jgi:hypothetical protein
LHAGTVDCTLKERGEREAEKAATRRVIGDSADHHPVRA